MDNDNLNVSHLAWCGLMALQTARRDGLSGSASQDNLFLTRWLLKEGREKGVRADLPGKLDYLWRAGNGNLRAQNDLFRLQHAVKLTGWIYMVLAESEWSGRRQLRLSPSVSGIYLNRSGLDGGFDEHGRQRTPLRARITGERPALDKLLQRSGWRSEPAGGPDPLLYHLLAEDFSGA